MISNFIKTTLRYLWRKKTYTAINFACLTFGLTCAVIALLYILNILRYDTFHRNYENLYQVNAYVTYFNGARFPKEVLSASLTDVLEKNAPEIREMTRIAEINHTFKSGENEFAADGFYADASFFDIFTFPLKDQNNNTVANDPGSVLISERLARKLFGNTECIGKTLIRTGGEKNESFTVAGIFRDIPVQSSLRPDFVIPFSKFLEENQDALESGSSSTQIWMLLGSKSDRIIVENKIRKLIAGQETTLNQELFLFPLKEKVLYDYAAGKRVWREMEKTVIAGSIGFAILLIACFNFINLAIALNAGRNRETAVRKVCGSGSKSIILQFLGETLIITLASLIVALILVRFLLPVINSLLQSGLTFSLGDPIVIILLFAILLITTFVSGFMPAYYLASTSPAEAIKGKLVKTNTFSKFRQSLIVIQFTIPVVLIICMMVIRSQDRYMRNYDVGVEKNNVLILNNSAGIQKHSQTIRADLMSIPGVKAVSFTNCIPSRGTQVSNDISWEGKDPSEKLHFWCVKTDYDYNKAVQVNITKGRYLDISFPTDSSNFLINDVAAGIMKSTDPVGTMISVDGKKGTIVGVFKDFHSLDLAGPVVPTIIQIGNYNQPYILVRFSGNYPVVRDAVQKIYKNYESESPFNAILFRDLPSYSNLTLPSALIAFAFVISILLACAGLSGLAAFTTEKRTKEIGIRKVSGGTTLSVMRLLIMNYAKWLIIAFIIAVPVAFMFANIFLARFNFHTAIPLWCFVAGPLIAFVTAIVAVSSQTWKAAERNPVRSLRYE
jgi:ABC-type antimicrobial peptide transport system permease subunit